MSTNSTIDSSNLSAILPMLQMAKGSWDAYDAARRGRYLQGIESATKAYGGYQGLQKSMSPQPTASQEVPTTQSKFGMSQAEFMALDPQLRERMLRQLMGR